MSEGQALEDLANECSMIPKGTRIEDRFTDNESQNTKVFVKVAVDFQECDAAMRTNDPNEIQKIANVAFTQQLKRYQDLRETGVLEARSETQITEPQVEMTSETAPFWGDPSRFYETRQYVVYQKEIVVLSPPTAYAPSSPESKRFTSLITPATKEIQRLQEKQPTIRAQPWSHLPVPPRVDRPRVLSRSPFPILPNHAPIPTARPLPSAHPMPITRPMELSRPMSTGKPTSTTKPAPNFVRPSLPSGPIVTRPAPFHPHYTAPSTPVVVPTTPTHSAPYKKPKATTTTPEKKSP
jgi:hypothetical protein